MSKIFDIRCPEYSNVASYYDWDTKHRFKTFKVDDYVEYNGKEFNSLDEAEYWLLTVHPRHYIGSSIVERRFDGNADFMFIPNKDYYVGLIEAGEATCIQEFIDMRIKQLEDKLFK